MKMPGPACDWLGIGAGDGITAALPNGWRAGPAKLPTVELSGEPREDFEAGGFGGQAIEEGVLVGSADDEEAP